MNKMISILLTATLAACAQAPESPYPVVKFNKDGGAKADAVAVSMIHHGSIALAYKNFQIQVDPVAKMGGSEIDYSSFPKADLILVTHDHGDHLDPGAIELLSKDGTRVILNASSQQKLGRGEVLANGESAQVGPVKVLAVPAYNNTEGHLQFHPKGQNNGYILEFNGLRIYVSGDTEDIEEMASFAPIDVAFLSANQPYTMTVEQCVRAAKALKPKTLVPYHLSNTDVQAIKDGLADTGIEVLLFEELR